MKRFLFEVMLIVGLVSAVFGSDTVYNQNLINGVVTSTTSIVINAATVGGDYWAFQLNTSSVTYYPSTFIDGVKSTGTIIVVSNTGVAGSTLTIQGNNYVDGIDYSHDTTYSSNTAYNLYKVLSSTYGVKASGYFTVLSTYSLTNASVTVAGVTFVQGTDWFVTTTATGTAKSIASAINNYFNGTITSLWSSTKANLTANNYGAKYDYSLTSWVSTITASGAAMTGGTNAPLSGIVFSSSSVNASSMIIATATVVGPSGNYTFTSSTPTALYVAGMSSGTASQIQYAPFYTVYSTQPYTAGLAVLFTVTSGSAPVYLTANTTYFVIPYDATRIRLATTRDNAIAGVSLPLTNTTLDRGSFALTAVSSAPASGLGNFGVTWQGSIDGNSYWNLGVASTTAYSTATWTTQNWDFGKYDYQFIRCSITPAINTLGSIYLQIIGFAKKIAP